MINTTLRLRLPVFRVLNLEIYWRDSRIEQGLMAAVFVSACACLEHEPQPKTFDRECLTEKSTTCMTMWVGKCQGSLQRTGALLNSVFDMQSAGLSLLPSVHKLASSPLLCEPCPGAAFAWCIRRARRASDWHVPSSMTCINTRSSCQRAGCCKKALPCVVVPWTVASVDCPGLDIETANRTMACLSIALNLNMAHSPLTQKKAVVER